MTTRTRRRPGPPPRQFTDRDAEAILRHLRPGPTLAELESQCDAFRRRAIAARDRLDDLTKGAGPFGVDSGRTARVAKARDEFHKQTQGYANAIRILAIAREAAQEGTEHEQHSIRRPANPD